MLSFFVSSLADSSVFKIIVVIIVVIMFIAPFQLRMRVGLFQLLVYIRVPLPPSCDYCALKPLWRDVKLPFLRVHNYHPDLFMIKSTTAL